MEFSRQEYWSRLPFPPPGDLPDPGIEPVSIMAPALAGELFTPVPPGKPLFYIVFIKFRKGDFLIHYFALKDMNYRRPHNSNCVRNDDKYN